MFIWFFNLGIRPNSEVSRIAVTKAVQLYRNACSSCKQIAQHSVLGGSILKFIDALSFTLKVDFFDLNFTFLCFYFEQNPEFEIKSSTCPVEVSTELLLAITVALSNMKATENSALEQRIPDLIRYVQLKFN